MTGVQTCALPISYFHSLGLTSLIKRVYKKGPHEVVFELNRPDASFLATLASDYAIVLSAEYGEQMDKAGTPELLDSQPIGTGPFSFKEYRHNEFVRYLRHPGYWGGEVKIEQLIYDITPKSSKRLAKLLTGECDVMSTPSASQLSVIDKDSHLNLSVQSGMNVAFLALNTRKAPFNKVQVRQALASALEPSEGRLASLIGFVVLLTICHGLARMTAGKMLRTGDQSLYPRMELLVSGVWMSALAAITLAVLAFEP